MAYKRMNNTLPPNSFHSWLTYKSRGSIENGPYRIWLKQSGQNGFMDVPEFFIVGDCLVTGKPDDEASPQMAIRLSEIAAVGQGVVTTKGPETGNESNQESKVNRLPPEVLAKISGLIGASPEDITFVPLKKPEK